MPTKNFEVLSDSLTPDEVKNKEFKRAVWGYSPDQVIEFLEAVSKSWERVQKREKELIEQIRGLHEQNESLVAREAEQVEVINRERQNARADAEKYFQEAKFRSDEIRAKTEEWLTTVITQVEEIERRRNSFLTAFKSALDQHYALLNTDLEKNQALESQLSGFLSTMGTDRTTESLPPKLL